LHRCNASVFLFVEQQISIYVRPSVLLALRTGNGVGFKITEFFKTGSRSAVDACGFFNGGRTKETAPVPSSTQGAILKIGPRWSILNSQCSDRCHNFWAFMMAGVCLAKVWRSDMLVRPRDLADRISGPLSLKSGGSFPTVGLSSWYATSDCD
jgi:hypothetical protein